MQNTIFVEATFQVVGSVKKQVMARPQTLVLPVNITDADMVSDPKVFSVVLFAMIDTAIRNEAAKAFIQRLKTETGLKRMVGGTKWSVELVGDIEAQPLYLKEAKMGDFYQFIKGKRVMKWDEEQKKQFPGMVYPNLQGQIIERNTALVKQLYEQPMNRTAANDGDEKQVA